MNLQSINRDAIAGAQDAFGAGRFADAERICRDIIEQDQRCADAWHLMGLLARQAGDIETTREFLALAVEISPECPEFLSDLGTVCTESGEFEKGLYYCQQAYDLSPESKKSIVALADAMIGANETDGAMALFQKALQANPKDVETLIKYALGLQRLNRTKEAISHFRMACRLDPRSVEALFHLAVALESAHAYGDAMDSYEKALKINSHVGVVWYRKSKLLNRLQKFELAFKASVEALRCEPEGAAYYYEEGFALQNLRRTKEALQAYNLALAKGLDSQDLHCNRGVALKDLADHPQAIRSFHRAVQLDPRNVRYLNNLGAASLDMGLNSEALACFQHVLELDPKMPSAYNNIASLLKDRGKSTEALPYFRKSAELQPERVDTRSNLLLCLQYMPNADPNFVFAEHKKWGEWIAKKNKPAFKHKTTKRSPDAKIRIGIVSADLCQHPVAHFIEPFLKEYDRTRFEVFVYADLHKPDSVSARMEALVDRWSLTQGLDARSLARRIYGDRIDVLLELAGHTALNRLEMIALKPAPVQISYVGYPSTTGLQTIDFRITDEVADPTGVTEHLHAEKLLRLPECAWCFSPYPASPEVSSPPVERNHFITFGCFNNMAKLNEELFKMWVAILNRVPNSRLRVKAKALMDMPVRKEMLEYFIASGIDEERIDFSGHTKGITAHLEEYSKVDIALDSFPYHGTTTTCEALWMGVPVVSLAGKTHVSRVGASLLRTVGLGELVADSAEQYIQFAAVLASDIERLALWRSSMRHRMLASPLMNQKIFAHNLGDLLASVVK
jgi:predicted O-linked N-acetylglucosamine transferase (SPINDLY family)